MLSHMSKVQLQCCDVPYAFSISNSAWQFFYPHEHTVDGHLKWCCMISLDAFSCVHIFLEDCPCRLKDWSLLPLTACRPVGGYLLAFLHVSELYARQMIHYRIFYSFHFIRFIYYLFFYFSFTNFLILKQG